MNFNMGNEDNIKKSTEQIETEKTDQVIEKAADIVKRAKEGIAEMTKSASLPPDLHRQAEAAAKIAIEEIDAVAAIETSFAAVEQLERIHSGEVGALVDNVSIILKNELEKITDPTARRNFNRRLGQWNERAAEILTGNKTDARKVAFIRTLFKTKFPTLASMPADRQSRAGSATVNEEFVPESGNDRQLEPDFGMAKSFDELYQLIDKYGPIEGGLGTYDPKVLKGIIEQVTKGELTIDFVAATGGLRDKVEELLLQSKQKKQPEAPAAKPGEKEIKILSAEELKGLNDQELDKLYYDLVGSKRALLLGRKRSPEESAYFGRLVFESSQRSKKTKTTLAKNPETAGEKAETDKPDFSQAKSLAEIYELVDKFGKIRISNNSYDPSILKSIIRDVAEGKMGPEYLFESYGLKAAVEKILPQMKAIKEKVAAVDSFVDLEIQLDQLGNVT